MVLDALGAQRMLGMIQPRCEDGEGGLLFGTGCAARISSFSETADGRLLIVLTGVCRFDLGEELPTIRGYRRVKAHWDRFADDYQIMALQSTDHASLESHLRPYCQQRGLEVDWKAVRAMELESTVNFFSMNLPFEPPEKQALLEAQDLEQRAGLLVGFADMALAADEAGSGARH